MEPMQAVRHRIRELQEIRGITANALAGICGICPSSLHNILNGRQANVSIAMLQKICDGLEINLTEFFSSDCFRAPRESGQATGGIREGAEKMRSKEALQRRILEFCEQRHMSINALAAHCGIRQSTLNNIVGGRNNSATIYTIDRLCRGLGISICEFFNAECFQNIEQEIY